MLKIDADGVPSIADKASKQSKAISTRLIQKLGEKVKGSRLAGQSSGHEFELLTVEFLENTFPRLTRLRPGNWSIRKISGNRLAIAEYEQYSHLAYLSELSKGNTELAAALGNAYSIAPDVVVVRNLVANDEINFDETIIDDDVANHSDLLVRNGGKPLLHASVSCKWTIRSDRAQNARSEALNFIRNRKGRSPHICVVTAEPTPSRLSSLALGTGDIDCLYHFALSELMESIRELDYEDAMDLLAIMVEGKRLKDISDLPLDLAT